MEKHESIEEELDHWTNMRNSRRSKQLRELSTEYRELRERHYTTPKRRRDKSKPGEPSWEGRESGQAS